MKNSPSRNLLLFYLISATFTFALCSWPIWVYAAETKVDNNCARIVSLSPSITALLVQLNLGRSIVAVSKFDSIISRKELTILGGYLDLKLEAVVATKPSIVIGLTEHKEILESISNLGFRTLALNHNRLNSLVDSIQELGSICGELASSEQLAFQFNQAISVLNSGVSKNQSPQTALIIIHYANTDLEQSFVLGENSILSDLLNHLNIRPWLTGQSKLYSEIKEIQLLVDRPNLLIVVEMPNTNSNNEAILRFVSKIRASHLLSEIPLITLQNPGFAIPGYQFQQTLTELSEQLCSISEIKCSK